MQTEEPSGDGAADPSGATEPIRAEVVENGIPVPGGDGAAEQITQPTKLIRIASMVRTMLEEVRRAPLDDAGRRALREIHEKSVGVLEDVLSPELRKELEEVTLPFTSETPTESELRLAQAQLVGWLEGLFHGIQASLFTQQAAAQAQLEEMRRQRALHPGMPAPPGEVAAPSGYL